jgi:DNA-binding GntR family transcriptional regulator
MGRTRYEALRRRIIENLAFNYGPGELYRTLRGMAADFGASLQTVQSAVSSLCDEGLLRSKEKVGSS